jgi:prepilin-type N-terminal cleavage/methylation domain-containing protein
MEGSLNEMAIPCLTRETGDRSVAITGIADMRNPTMSPKATRGFSLTEVLAAVSIIMILAGIAIPNFMSAMHTARLRGAVSDFASLLQTARFKAVDDNRYYSIYALTPSGHAPWQGFVDIYPQNADGTSGSGGSVCNTGDPSVTISSEVRENPQGSAPATASLKAQLLPANSPVVVKDASLTSTPATFGPRGLPCQLSGGVCNSLGGPQAYWIFFQNNVTQTWGAVTVTPAGRIQRWLYSGAAGTWTTF